MKVHELTVRQRIVISLAGPILLALITFIGYIHVVKATAETVKKHSKDFVRVNKDVARIDKGQAVLESQIPEIKKSVDRIETAQMSFQKETRIDFKQILHELAKINGDR